MSAEIALLQRLVTSPFTRRRFWDERPVIGLVAGESHWVIRDRGLFPPKDELVDAVIRCSEEDLDAMAAGRAPVGPVSTTLGDRPGADRRKQARVLLALAALGWCGPWPDPAVDPEHVRLVRAAHYDLGIGPADGGASLFPDGGPLPGVTVRLTHGVKGAELVTVGLADTIGRPELATIVPGRGDPRTGFPALRAAALYVAEEGRLPARLALPRGAWARSAERRVSSGGGGPRSGSGGGSALPPQEHAVLTSAPHPAFRDGLALPNQLTWLLRVGAG